MPIINLQNCQLIEQYLSYLTVIKGRSDKTIREYRLDLLMFFQFVHDSRNRCSNNHQCEHLRDVDIEFI